VKTGNNGAGVPSLSDAAGDELFGRVASILEQARASVVRAVNHNMVVAYWLIGREIVMELQRGQERAGYGERLVEYLSARLTATFGRWYSPENLWKFRLFFVTFPVDSGILSTVWTESKQLDNGTNFRLPEGAVPAFDNRLSWSHYRALMRVEISDARKYYEREAADANWSVRELERQIHTHSYQRLVATQIKRVTSPAQTNPLESLKDPYVLEFLDIPDSAVIHESGVEAAIIEHLRDFLLELGKGFAFVARQKRLSFDDQHLFVDLVFYNIPLRCYLLIDLKAGKLTHADVGQMDGYVRMFDDLVAGSEDNPTIGLILCTEHNSAVARYSVLNDRRQIFASRYVTCLPTEAELVAEVQRGRALAEGRMSVSES